MYNISDMTNREWREFAMYSIADRAIPSMIDGLKPSQRFYLYSSIVNTPKQFANVDDVASSTKKYGYRHGSTEETGQGLASKWKNNICLVEGEGSFGSRMVQEAAAPRYTKTRLHSNFEKYIKDLDLAPEHDDPEHIPPAFYIPVLPLVLINGVRGIATGWATTILPRSINSVVAACDEYIKTGDIKKTKLEVSFPEFTGKVVDEGDGKFKCYGDVELKGKTSLLIKEIPYGYDREKYVSILNKLEDDNKIVGYDDLCDKNGFCFDVKLKRDYNPTRNNILKDFKLVISLSENINVIGPDNKLRNYQDPNDLIIDFVNYRMGVLQQRIDLAIETCVKQGQWATLKMKFVKAVLADQIDFRGRKKADVIADVVGLLGCEEETAERLLKMNLLSFTDELVIKLREEINEKREEIQYWKTTTPTEQYEDDMKAIT